MPGPASRRCSGGAGPAVLAATLLLAGRDAAAWKDGTKVSRPAFSEPLPADFGRFVGGTLRLFDKSCLHHFRRRGGRRRLLLQRAP